MNKLILVFNLIYKIFIIIALTVLMAQGSDIKELLRKGNNMTEVIENTTEGIEHATEGIEFAAHQYTEWVVKSFDPHSPRY